MEPLKAKNARPTDTPTDLCDGAVGEPAAIHDESDAEEARTMAFVPA